MDKNPLASMPYAHDILRMDRSSMKWFWIGWILLFIGGESTGLFIIKGGTFSEFVWKIERYARGESIASWSFGHLAIALLFLWLFFHFAFRMWT